MSQIECFEPNKRALFFIDFFFCLAPYNYSKCLSSISMDYKVICNQNQKCKFIINPYIIEESSCS